jgi:hypothetical protein
MIAAAVIGVARRATDKGQDVTRPAFCVLRDAIGR